MNYRRVVVTPEIAKSWLAGNVGNRSVSTPTVDAYARAMRDGRWILSPCPIVRNGSRLFDGQHRLLAVVQSGMAIEFWVCEGADESVVPAIDRGRPRTVVNILQLHHGVENAKRLAAAARCFAQLDSVYPPGTKLLDGEIVDLAARYQVELDWVLARPSVRTFGNSAFLSALAWVFPLYPESVNAFYEGVSSGSGLRVDGSELRLRDRMKDGFSGDRYGHSHLMLLTLAALRYAIDGQKCGVLKVSTHAFERFWKERNGKRRFEMPAWAREFSLAPRRDD